MNRVNDRNNNNNKKKGIDPSWVYTAAVGIFFFFFRSKAPFSTAIGEPTDTTNASRILLHLTREESKKKEKEKKN